MKLGELRKRLGKRNDPPPLVVEAKAPDPPREPSSFSTEERVMYAHASYEATEATFRESRLPASTLETFRDAGWVVEELVVERWTIDQDIHSGERILNYRVADKRNGARTELRAVLRPSSFQFEFAIPIVEVERSKPLAPRWRE